MLDKLMGKLPFNQPNIVEAVNAEPPELTDEQINQVSQEVADPETTLDYFTLGGRQFPLIMLPWKYERKMMEVIAPYCRILTDAAGVGQMEGYLEALLVEAQHDITRVAVIIMGRHFRDDQNFAPIAPVVEDGKVISPGMTTDQRIEEWLNEECHFQDIAELVLKQVRKNKVADSLGKLWAPNVLALKTLRVLNTLPHHITQLLESK